MNKTNRKIIKAIAFGSFLFKGFPNVLQHQQAQATEIINILPTRWIERTNFNHFHIAAMTGDLKAIIHLANTHNDNEALRRDINQRSAMGWTSLHFAVLCGHPEVVQVLLKLGANANAETINFAGNETPLHFAAKEGHSKIIQILLNNNANVNAIETIMGKTPLHYAVQYGHLKIVQVLLTEEDINVNARTMLGYTPLGYAYKYGQFNIVKALAERDAKI